MSERDEERKITMTIRPMEEKDLDQAASLEQQNFSRPWSRDAFADALKKEYYLYYVAVDDAQNVLGMAGVICLDHEGEITNVCVREDARKQGIAFSLLTEIFNICKNLEILQFTLEVRKSNLPAINLYQKLGFQNEGIRKDFYEAPVEDAVIMWKW